MLLPLLCTSLQSSLHIATDLENLSTEIHDLSSRVANLDLSPLPPNLAPLQASLRNIASRLPSAAQTSFPPQRPNVPQQATHSPSVSGPAPSSNTNPACQEKGKERAPLAPPPPPPNTVWPSSSADPDLLRYDMSTSPPTLYGNPEAFAKRYPHTWEVEEFAKGKYPTGPAWTPGHLDPDWRPPTTMTSNATPTYAQAAAPPTKEKKGRQMKGPVSASTVVVASGEVFTKPPPPLPQAVRRFFASSTTFKPHPEVVNIAAHFPDIAASVLREANCCLLLSFTCTVNDKGAVSFLGTNLHTPPSAYTPYFTALTTRLNTAFPVGNSPWDLFQPAPNETQLLIHCIPLDFLPSADHQLFPSLHESIRNARGVSILSARYLNPDPESREQKRAPSVVVTVAPPRLMPSSPQSTSSPEIGESNKCSPPLKTPSVRSAGSSATSPTAVPARCPSVPSAHSHIQKGSIAALTLPARRVAIFNQSSLAALPQWHAALTARKSTLRAAGIVAPAKRPPKTHQKCHLNRRRTAWISLKTRLVLRRSFVQHQVPLLTPRVPLYSPAMLLHLGKGPNAPSPISPQERAVMNPLTPTPLRALPDNGEFLHSIHRQQGCLPVLSNCST